MKKHLIILVLCSLIQFKSKSQVYSPFPDSNAVWQVYSREIGCTCCASYHYALEGDTLINSTSYQIVHKYGTVYMEAGNGACTSIVLNVLDEYIGALRSDNILKKVFILPHDSLNEYLLYDFNMSTGDTLQGWLNYSDFLGWDPTILVVESIDSIFIGHQYRKRFNFLVPGSPGTPVPKFIEGIGSTFDPFSGPLYEFEWGVWLTCFSHNNQTLYPDTNSVCLVTHVEQSESSNLQVNISPNPFTAQLTISLEMIRGDIWKYSIQDIFGRIVNSSQKHLENSTSKSIDLSNLSNGIYFVEIFVNGERTVKKILKNNH